MKHVLAATAAAFGLLVALPALAADDDAPVYDNGPVWQVTEIEVKYGHFNDYMKYLDTSWKQRFEALKAEKRVLDYRILINEFPRKGEGNVLLCVLYPNMAVFDIAPADEMAFSKKVSGPIAQQTKASDDRGQFRTVLDTVAFREAKLK